MKKELVNGLIVVGAITVVTIVIKGIKTMMYRSVIKEVIRDAETIQKKD